MTSVLTTYIRAAMERALVERLADEGTFYAEIPGFDGVWANAATADVCRAELQEVLEEWMLFRIANAMPLPAVDGPWS